MADPADARRGASARRTLTLLVLVCAAPVVASYAAYYYYGLRPSAHVNYGELLDTRPAPEITGAADDGAPWRLSSLRGRWVLLIADTAACDVHCEQVLYATRQARTMQNRERERIVRVLLQPPGAPPLPARLREQHPGIIVVRGDPAQWKPLSAPDTVAGILLVDPLGNLVLRYPADLDIRRLAKDLERLLRASRIG